MVGRGASTFAFLVCAPTASILWRVSISWVRPNRSKKGSYQSQRPVDNHDKALMPDKRYFPYNTHRADKGLLNRAITDQYQKRSVGVSKVNYCLYGFQINLPSGFAYR